MRLDLCALKYSDKTIVEKYCFTDKTMINTINNWHDSILWFHCATEGVVCCFNIWKRKWQIVIHLTFFGTDMKRIGMRGTVPDWLTENNVGYSGSWVTFMLHCLPEHVPGNLKCNMHWQSLFTWLINFNELTMYFVKYIVKCSSYVQNRIHQYADPSYRRTCLIYFI